MRNEEIPFNRPYLTGHELKYIAKAAASGHKLAGDGPYTKLCHDWLQEKTGCVSALLTPSCTAALEMAAMLTDVGPGDEIIMPSFTFVSSANAFVLRGATPVFVDIREDTLNIDENLIEEAITQHTKAIVPVHYAGVACEMNDIMALARKYNLMVVEDAAQAIMSAYKTRSLGSIGQMGAFSFHDTKNIMAGECGALLLNDPDLVQRAEIIREKGTDRNRFFRGEVDKYTWQEVGSSYLPSDLTAAFLLAQMENAEEITSKRMSLWKYYHQALFPLESRGLLRRPRIPQGCLHNGHIYYILTPPGLDRQHLIEKLKGNGISATFHYVPLHNAPAGRRLCRTHGDLKNTEEIAARILRLPLWIGLEHEHQDRVISLLDELLEKT